MSIGAISSGLSGLRSAQMALDVSAHNIANANTAGFNPQTIPHQESPTGGVSSSISAPQASGQAAESGTDLATETVNSLVYKHQFGINAKVIQTADQNLGTLVNIKA